MPRIYGQSTLADTAERTRKAHRGLALRDVIRAFVTVATALAATMGMASMARADFAVTGFGGSANNPDGRRNAQAGAHPDFSTRIDFATVERNGVIVPAEDVKDVDVALPPGLVGNPAGIPTCTMEQLSNNAIDWLTAAVCPVDSQVGVADLAFSIGGPSSPIQSGIYNIEPPKGSPALFGFNVLGTIVLIEPELRGDDYGLSVHVKNISQSIAVLSNRITLWGVPALPVHDAERFFWFSQGFASGLQPKAFMTAPMNCAAGPLTTSMRARSWQQQDRWSTASFDRDFNGDPLAAEGCDVVPFKPTFDAAVDTTAPDAGVGLRVKLGFPQDGLVAPDGIATGHLKKATVVLPDGMTINPASAGGLTACDDGLLKLGSSEADQCPLTAKIGTAEATTPLLTEHLTGGIYLRPQASLNPASGDLFRIALVLSNAERGIMVKLPGSIRADDKGQLTATFDNNPQLPISTVDLQFKGGSRAPLATPASCGTKTVNAELSAWSGQTVQRQSSYNVDCTPGLGGFTPSFSAGTKNPVGGAFSPLGLSIGKPDGNAPLAGLRMELPRGLLAQLAGNIGTQVGTVNALAGPGATPYVLPGQVYLEGAYDDAPFSLRVVVPAKAGPFDLGTVVVRQRIYVDRNDAHVTVVSDPIPQIVSGVPVRLQRLDVNIDKPGFIINPTSCQPKTISASLSSIAGQTAAVSSRFQVGDCSSLPYAPKLSLKVGERGKLTRGKRTPLDVTLTMSRGQTNNRSVQVTLPLAINARLDVVNKRRACSLEQFRADRCPMVVGTATASTPLLSRPLSGPAYFVYTPDRRLPDLVVRLKGEVAFDLIGKVTLDGLKLRTTFDAVPDVPISSFRLRLASGSTNGPVGLTRNACLAATRRALVAGVQFKAQNNKTITRSQKIAVAGCGRTARRAVRRAAKK